MGSCDSGFRFVNANRNTPLRMRWLSKWTKEKRAETQLSAPPHCFSIRSYWPTEAGTPALAICFSAAREGVEKCRVRSQSGSSMAVT